MGIVMGGGHSIYPACGKPRTLAVIVETTSQLLKTLTIKIAGYEKDHCRNQYDT